jgi:hypothetical protein
MPADVSELTAEVTRARGVVDSAIALINGIAARIDAAVAADNVADATNLSALSASLRSETDDLAAAVNANP